MIHPHIRAAFVLCFAGATLLEPSRAIAQDTHVHATAPAAPAWKWSWDANVFFGWNYQLREFTDFQRVESQNWLMGGVERSVAGGRLQLHSMLSFEPFTIQPLGSPQVFQTGETYQQAPLIDYQHPHDLFMALGATWSRRGPAGGVFFTAAPVGEPALGPPPFMHRASAAENPTAPLGHHEMDSTHITHGVLTGGITHRALTVEASWFHGGEPDENRKDLEFGPLDSYSGRVSWRQQGWHAQFSAGHLTTPEFVEPFSDVTRFTASISYTAPDERIATTLLWGQNREVHGILDAYLAEGTFRPAARHALYGRAELTTKDILGAGGRHPPGFVHPHPLSRVAALTGGYVYELRASRIGQFGLGGDATIYYVPPNLKDNYGSPASFHVFLHYRPRARGAQGGHDMHHVQ